MNSLALSFNEVNFAPVQQGNQVWLTSTELSKALGYAKSDAVTQVFERNQDEFNSSMTLTLKLRVKGFGSGNSEKESRIFSLRGAHLIAMFSKTPIAKEFRKWVLDVLAQEVTQQQINTRVKINAQQQTELKEIVDRRCEGSVKKRTELWSRHNQHFRIPRYSELLAIHFQDAVNYLETMQIKAQGNIHIDENQSIEMLCVYSKLFQSWWYTHSPALAKLNPLLVSMLHDCMFSMTYAVSDVCKKHSIVLPEYDYKHMFELKMQPHQRYKLLN